MPLSGVEIMDNLADEINRELTAVLAQLFQSSLRMHKFKDAADNGEAGAIEKLEKEKIVIGKLGQQQQVLKGRLARLEKRDVPNARANEEHKQKEASDVLQLANRFPYSNY